MDNRKYEAIITISETGSITRAADIMDYTQSGLTQMVRSLEKELGLTLLTRTNRGVSLTNACRQLLPLIREEQLAEERIRQECALIKGRKSGRITIGCLSSVSEAWMPYVLEAMAEQYPDIRVSLQELETPVIMDKLAEGRLDLGICEYYKDDEVHADVTSLMKDEIYVIVPPDHPLADRDRISLSKLSEYPFISYAVGESRLNAPGWPERILKKARLNIAYTCKDNLTVIKMVQHNVGLSIASDIMAANYPMELACLHLDPPLYRTLCVVQRPDEKALPAAEIFINALKDHIKNNGRSK